MPLSWNEIKDRALKFSRDWGDESAESAEAKPFLDAFLNQYLMWNYAPMPTRSDKNWGMSDCLSFTVMRQSSLDAALTINPNFIQAGFRALLRENPPTT